MIKTLSFDENGGALISEEKTIKYENAQVKKVLLFQKVYRERS